MAAQVVVADPDGHRPVALRVALGFCIRLWRWAFYLHIVLSRSKGAFAPAPGRSLWGKLEEAGPHQPPIYVLPLRDSRQNKM